MKILVVHNRYRSGAPSGETRVVERESQALSDRGHVVEQFERHSDSIEQFSLAKKAVLPGQVIWSDEARRSLNGVLRTFRPDLVHVHNTFPLISPSILFACRQHRVPVVVTIHNSRLLCASGELFRNGATCHDCLQRRIPVPSLIHRCYRGSLAATAPIALGIVAHRRTWRTMVSAYIFISEAARANLSNMGLPAERTFVKANLVPRVTSHGERPELEPIVTFVGRLDAAKGIPLLMQAWDLYTRDGRGEGLQLMIAGSGPLAAQVSDWALARPSVTTTGLLSAADCAALMARSRAVILPSQWEEPFGLVAIEAMAAGVPPIATAHGAFPELISDGVDGVLFEPRSVEALTSVLRDVDACPERYRLYGEAASRTYKERFDPDRNLDRLTGIYNFAIDNPVFRTNGRRAGGLSRRLPKARL